METCTECGGSGECQECKIRGFDDECVTCDGSGACDECGGEGEI